MPRFTRTPARRGRALLSVLAGALALAACADQQPIGSMREPGDTPSPRTLQAFLCTGSRSGVVCTPDRALNGRGTIIGNQGVYVKLTSSNVTYDPVTDTLAFDVTVQNLMNEAMGTPDGTTPGLDGIRVFFRSGPTVTVGSGEVTVANADGTDAFTAGNQPYFRYDQILTTNQVSDPKTWKLIVPQEATTFTFKLLVDCDVQYLLVINEVMANPNGSVTTEQPLEWFELYNAGTLPVDLQNMVIADSAASGRRPYHKIASSVVIPSGGYAVLGGSSNTTVNGGVPVDYSYGTALNQLANSLDAVKIARLVGPEPNPDTVTVDRTQYSNASISAKEGISRELKNPALDNSNMDGSNWGDASVTAVYGTGGRGTPKAQNSAFTP